MKKSNFIAFGLLVAGMLTACATGRLSSKANKLEREGQFAQAALLHEEAAGKSSGMAASRSWYRAGNLWIEPSNPQRSFKRALTCFYRVDRAKADRETANDTRLWISIITQLISAKERAAALKDAAAGSEQLYLPLAEPAKKAVEREK